MIDSYGRTIDYLRLSVTELCNLRCGYCMPPEGVCKRSYNEICSLEELTELAAACVELGVKKIRLTGGEPLVRRGILSLVKALRALPGLEELDMTTNGSLLPALAAPLRDAGLDRLNISLDSLRPERYRAITRLGSLDQVLAGIAAAEQAGFDKLSINVVLLKGVNEDELRPLAELAREKPWQVRFIELMPIGPGAELGAFLPARRVLEAVPELKEATGNGQQATASVGAVIGRPEEASGNEHPATASVGAVIGCPQEASGNGQQATASVGAVIGRPPLPARSGVARLYTAPGWAGTVGLITPMSCEFCGSCSRIRITADGNLKLCLHAPEEIPLRGLHGEALRAAILAAVARKPARHHLLEAQSQSARPMNRIGG